MSYFSMNLPKKGFEPRSRRGECAENGEFQAYCAQIDGNFLGLPMTGTGYDILHIHRLCRAPFVDLHQATFVAASKDTADGVLHNETDGIRQVEKRAGSTT